MGRDRRQGWGRRAGRWALYGVAAIALLAAAGAAGGYGFLLASRPALEGTVTAPGLTHTVVVERDEAGTATIIAADRADMARALGFLHGQERYFQMDLLRRSAAGELGELVGDAALPVDRQRRLHRFRTRADALLAGMGAEERRILDAYVAGVNEGLSALSARPFEYALLRQSPRPWAAQDTLLVTWAMYFDLQDSSGARERSLQAVVDALGPDWAAFLYPVGTSMDAALDGSLLSQPSFPDALPPADTQVRLTGGPAVQGDGAGAAGSNAWVVGGALTAHGGAMVADDMHLGHGMPNIWYRARLVLTAPDGEILNDAVGATLPGTPNLVVGSNGHIAWGFTNSYIDTGDAVLLEAGSAAGSYLTPDGERLPERVVERICGAAGCEELVVEETTWGPVVAEEEGQRIAWRWVAHDMDAGALAGLLGLERARSVAEAVEIAHGSSIPNQNLVVGDREGSIAWTVMGRVPRRVGFDGQLPVSWADGSRGWDGWLAPAEVPVVRDPDNARIWTANARVIGGPAFDLLGDGGYAHGGRAGQIRDGLLARDSFTEQDHLDIQLDDRGRLLDRWQELMLATLEGREGAAGALIPLVRNWGGRAVPDSAGYRLVRQFRQELIRIAYQSYLGLPEGDRLSTRRFSGQADESVWRLVSERPAHLVPPGHTDWPAVMDAAVAAVLEDVGREAGGDPAAYRWGERNRPGVRHPLSRFVPVLARLTDPPDEPLPGDVFQPRVQARGFGASQRMVVSPGREEDGIFHMPGSQSGHPLSPYYLAGHDDWREGRPSPLLPGPARWTLTFQP